ncbi:MAG: hypothetical protein L0Y75_10945 [Acidobacteria bacterium]|nr:hypothetical protein [Acidobacteriota bacterium]
MIHRNPIMACVIKQYGTGLYRACVSFNKGHTVFLSAHQDEESANETIHRFQEACLDGKIKTTEDVASFISSFDYKDIANQSMISRDNELSLAA